MSRSRMFLVAIMLGVIAWGTGVLDRLPLWACFPAGMVGGAIVALLVKLLIPRWHL